MYTNRLFEKTVEINKMKRKLFLVFLAMILAVLSAANSAIADVYSNSGEFMFKNSGNDVGSEDALEIQIENWFSSAKGLDVSVEMEFYAKVDAPSTATGSPTLLTLTYGDDNKSGTWNTIEAISFYSVKAANEYALYYVEWGATDGTWSTEHLLTPNGKNIPEISHFSAWIWEDAPPP